MHHLLQEKKNEWLIRQLQHKQHLLSFSYQKQLLTVPPPSAQIFSQDASHLLKRSHSGRNPLPWILTSQPVQLQVFSSGLLNDQGSFFSHPSSHTYTAAEHKRSLSTTEGFPHVLLPSASSFCLTQKDNEQLY